MVRSVAICHTPLPTLTACKSLRDFQDLQGRPPFLKHHIAKWKLTCSSAKGKTNKNHLWPYGKSPRGVSSKLSVGTSRGTQARCLLSGTSSGPTLPGRSKPRRGKKQNLHAVFVSQRGEQTNSLSIPPFGLLQLFIFKAFPLLVSFSCLFSKSIVVDVAPPLQKDNVPSDGVSSHLCAWLVRCAGKECAQVKQRETDVREMSRACHQDSSRSITNLCSERHKALVRGVSASPVIHRLRCWCLTSLLPFANSPEQKAHEGSKAF